MKNKDTNIYKKLINFGRLSLKTFKIAIFSIGLAVIVGLFFVGSTIKQPVDYKFYDNHSPVQTLPKQSFNIHINLSHDYSDKINSSFQGFNFLNTNSKSNFAELVLSLHELGNNKYLKNIFVDMSSGISLSNVEMNELGKVIDKLNQNGINTWVLANNISNIDELILFSKFKIRNMITTGGIQLWSPTFKTLFFGETLKKYGIDANFFQEGKYKGAIEPFKNSKPSPEVLKNLEQLRQSIIKNNANRLQQINTEATFNLASGQFVSAKEATKTKIVSNILHLSDVVFNIEKSAKTWINGTSINTKLLFNGNKKIAIIYLNGTIVDKQEQSDVISASQITQAVAEIVKNKKIYSGVIVRVNTPGGSVTGSEKISYQLNKIKLNNIPLYVSYSDVAASGGIWSTTFAEKIYANENSVVGSIGVLYGYVNFDQFLQKNFAVKSHTYGDNPFVSQKNLNSYNKKQFIKSTKHYYELFKQKVMQGRLINENEFNKIGQGRIFSGSDALNNKLVTNIGDLYTVIEDIKKNYKIKDNVSFEYFPKMSLDNKLSFLTEMLGGKSNITNSVKDNILKETTGLTVENINKPIAILPYKLEIK